jgi:hypothetical protein
MTSTLDTLVQVVCQYFTSLHDVQGLKFSIETIDNPGWAIAIPVLLSDGEDLRERLGTPFEYNGDDGEWINVCAHLKETRDVRNGVTGAPVSIANVEAVGSPRTLHMLCNRVVSMIGSSANSEQLERTRNAHLLEEWLSRRADDEWEHIYRMSFEIEPNVHGIGLVASAEVDVYSVSPEVAEQTEVSVAMTHATSSIVKVKMEGDPSPGCKLAGAGDCIRCGEPQIVIPDRVHIAPPPGRSRVTTRMIANEPVANLPANETSECLRYGDGMGLTVSGLDVPPARRGIIVRLFQASVS